MKVGDRVRIKTKEEIGPQPGGWVRDMMGYFGSHAIISEIHEDGESGVYCSLRTPDGSSWCYTLDQFDRVYENFLEPELFILE